MSGDALARVKAGAVLKDTDLPVALRRLAAQVDALEARLVPATLTAVAEVEVAEVAEVDDGPVKPVKKAAKKTAGRKVEEPEDDQ